MDVLAAMVIASAVLMDVKKVVKTVLAVPTVPLVYLAKQDVKLAVLMIVKEAVKLVKLLLVPQYVKRIVKLVQDAIIAVMMDVHYAMDVQVDVLLVAIQVVKQVVQLHARCVQVILALVVIVVIIVQVIMVVVLLDI